MKIILASGSPRRREILTKLGYDFEIIKSDDDEITGKTKPNEVVEELSYNKAISVKNKLCMPNSNGKAEEDYVIVAADTVVSIDDIILGKPVNRKDAFNTVKMLQGRKHQVYTGVTIIRINDGSVINFSEMTDVYIKPMTDNEIYEYVASGECDDKAGSYAIQGIFAKYIERYEGDYDNVVGLPSKRVGDILKDIINS